MFTLDVTGFSSDGTINVEIVASSGVPVLAAIERELVPSAFAPHQIRVNSGSTTSIVDNENETWIADSFFSGGFTFSNCPLEIHDTVNDEIFCSERSGSFSYSIPVPGSGFYRVVLYFAEIFCKFNHIGTVSSKLFI